ncbi:unnamed protein product [Arabidopsis halleri]
MDPQVLAAASDIVGDEEWDIWNDAGFVYKPRKHRKENAVGEAYNQPDPAEEERNRRECKRKILTKLKRKY